MYDLPYYAKIINFKLNTELRKLINNYILNQDLFKKSEEDLEKFIMNKVQHKNDIIKAILNNSKEGKLVVNQVNNIKNLALKSISKK